MEGKFENESNNEVRIPLLEMVGSLREDMERLRPLTPNYCIYRVPKGLYLKNPAAYTPTVVSIGPFHHKREGLEAMEEYKQRYLKDFLDRAGKSLEDFAEFMKDREGRMRECYADTISLSSNDFVKIMMVDSAFLYEMMRRSHCQVDESCRIFNRPFMVADLMEDLMLLENQIPLFVLEDLYNLDKQAESNTGAPNNGDEETEPNMSTRNSEETTLKLEEENASDASSNSDNQDKLTCCTGMLWPLRRSKEPNAETTTESVEEEPVSFMDFVCKFVNWRGDIGIDSFNFDEVSSSKVVHILDCLRLCHLSPSQLSDSPESKVKTECCISIPCTQFLESETESQSMLVKVGKIVASSLERCLGLRQDDGIFHDVVPKPTITELHQSGVKFAENKESTYLLDIKFDRRDGTLRMPEFFMGDVTEKLFRNLLAFEQCHCDSKDSPLTNYFVFLDDLINETSDIDILVRAGVIQNTLGDNTRAASVINNIAQGLSTTGDNYFDRIHLELTNYYKVPRHKWKATLRQDYFNSPWTGISVIAAVILLVLTVIQTVYAIISN